MKKFTELEMSTQEEVALYVGPKFYEVYLKRWTEMEQKNSMISWNWSSFLFGTMWGVYRKMYAYMYGLLGVIAVVNILLLLIGVELGNTFSFVLWVLFGLYGNHFYLQHAIKEVEKLQKQIPNPEQRMGVLRAKSGGSAGAVWLFVFAVIGYACFMTFVTVLMDLP